MIHQIIYLVASFSSLLFFAPTTYEPFPQSEISFVPILDRGAVLPEQDSAIVLNKEIKKYHQFINLAARAIYKNDFQAASVYYDSAFAYKEIPYYVDIKNYILVNYKTKMFEKNDAKIKLLFSHKQIDSTLLFSELPNTVFSIKNIELIHRLSKSKPIVSKKSKNLQSALREMFIIDQKAHGFEGFRMQDSLEAQKALKKRDTVDWDNMIEFINLYEKNGFPTEEKIGVFYDKDLKWIPAISVLLLHFVAQKDTNDVKSILKIIKAEHVKGNLHPSIYAYVLDFLHQQPIYNQKPEYNFMNSTYAVVNGAAYRPFVFYNDSLMQEINTNRISIGLDSFHISQKQVVCQTIGAENLKNSHLIGMFHYANIKELPYGFVKYASEQAGIDMNTYKIDTEKILKECKCEEKIY